jgi:hypothetical protein
MRITGNAKNFWISFLWDRNVVYCKVDYGIATLFIVWFAVAVVSGEDCVCTFLRVDVYVIGCGPVMFTQQVYSADTLNSSPA